MPESFLVSVCSSSFDWSTVKIWQPASERGMKANENYLVHLKNVYYQYHMPSFVEIDPLVPEKKRFLKDFTIYGHGGHLGHVAWIFIHIGFPIP